MKFHTSCLQYSTVSAFDTPTYHILNNIYLRVDDLGRL